MLLNQTMVLAGTACPRQGGQGDVPAQGPLWLAAGTKGMECQVGFHAPDDGIRVKPA
jgi:hypothetical protein